MVFLGTPLRGTPAAGITQWLVLIRGYMGRSTSNSLIDGLKEKDNDLNNTIHDFAEIAIKYQVQIRCFYETLETQIAKAVVPSSLAKFFPTVKVYDLVSCPCLPLLTVRLSSFQENQLVLMVINVSH